MCPDWIEDAGRIPTGAHRSGIGLHSQTRWEAWSLGRRQGTRAAKDVLAKDAGLISVIVHVAGNTEWSRASSKLISIGASE